MSRKYIVKIIGIIVVAMLVIAIPMLFMAAIYWSNEDNAPVPIFTGGLLFADLVFVFLVLYEWIDKEDE